MNVPITSSPQDISPTSPTYRQTFPPLAMSAEIAKNTLGKNSSGTHSPKSLQDRVKQLEKEAVDKDAELVTLTEALKEALNNQSPFIKTLTVRIEAQDLRIKSLKEELNKCKEDERDEGQLRQTINGLEEELALVKKNEMELQNTATELRERNSTLETQLKTIKPKVEKVFTPTAIGLTKILEELGPIRIEVETLLVEIVKLRDSAQRTCEMISNNKDTVPILKKSLEDNDPKYAKLSRVYLDLQPRITIQLEDLKKSIEKATHEPIPEVHINAFSAENYMSMEEIKANEKAFISLRERCQEIYDTLSIDLNHIERRYGDAANHLNLIDATLGKKNYGAWAYAPGSSYIVEWKSKTRVSPTSPYFERELGG